MTTAAAPRRRARRGEGERLRPEILAAAKDLLAELGDADAVSVRAVADRVGVSTPSIYLHFADKAALLDAVCENVFAELHERMDEAAATTSDPFEGLKERGLAYVRFALANPEHYRLVMMRTPGNDSGATRFTKDDIVAGPTYSQLTEAVRQCIAAGVFSPEQDAELIATTLWAAAHGAVSLVLAKPDIAGEQAEAMCEHVIVAAGMGIALMGHLPPDCGPDITPALRTYFAARAPRS